VSCRFLRLLDFGGSWVSSAPRFFAFLDFGGFRVLVVSVSRVLSSLLDFGVFPVLLAPWVFNFCFLTDSVSRLFPILVDFRVSSVSVVRESRRLLGSLVSSSSSEISVSCGFWCLLDFGVSCRLFGSLAFAS
jgi:hypothetical protein